MFRGAIVRTSVATAAGPANGDPSEYVDVLLSDAGKKRAAQRALKTPGSSRIGRAAAPPATGIGNIRAGEKSGATVEAELRAPTLGDVVAELERARLFGILEELVLWKNTTNEEVLKRARTEIWQSWRRACAENAGHPRAERCSIVTRCLRSTTRSLAAAPCRSKRSGSASKPMPATSTRWRC